MIIQGRVDLYLGKEISPLSMADKTVTTTDTSMKVKNTDSNDQ